MPRMPVPFPDTFWPCAYLLRRLVQACAVAGAAKWHLGCKGTAKYMCKHWKVQPFFEEMRKAHKWDAEIYNNVYEYESDFPIQKNHN